MQSCSSVIPNPCRACKQGELLPTCVRSGLLAVLAEDVQAARLVIGSLPRVLTGLITPSPSSSSSASKNNHLALR